jgi:predicted kinase
MNTEILNNNIFKNEPIYIMFIGPPYSGKSKYIEDNKDFFSNYIHLSINNIINKRVESENKPFLELFNNHVSMRKFIEEFNTIMTESIIFSKNIVDEQTNTSKKGRSKKLISIGGKYTKIAIVFKPELEEIYRLHSIITENYNKVPIDVINSMYKNVEGITEKSLKEEGFDGVFFIKY